MLAFVPKTNLFQNMLRILRKMYHGVQRIFNGWILHLEIAIQTSLWKVAHFKWKIYIFIANQKQTNCSKKKPNATFGWAALLLATIKLMSLLLTFNRKFIYYTKIRSGIHILFTLYDGYSSIKRNVWIQISSWNP